MTDLNRSSVHAKGRARVEAFDYDGVRLLPGRLEEQVRRARDVYASIPNDSILKGFRREVGLPAPAKICAAGARREAPSSSASS